MMPQVPFFCELFDGGKTQMLSGLVRGMRTKFSAETSLTRELSEEGIKCNGKLA